jgi:hypothetical protein
VKITETIEPKRTTICLLPCGTALSSTALECDNVTADRRSMKAMLACLEGIPIVSTSWIGHCLQRKGVVVPEKNMFVRTLPTKTFIGSLSEFGVAYQAARIGHVQRHSWFLPLRRVKTAYMVGFEQTSHDTTNFCSLLSRAGVNDVVLNASMALSRLKEFVAQSAASIDQSTKSEFIEYYVIICNDGAKSSSPKAFFSDAFVREIHALASPATKPSHVNRRLMVVNLQWLFDSVTCGRLLPADTKSTTNGNMNAEQEAKAIDCYKPNHERASELWQITK